MGYGGVDTKRVAEGYPDNPELRFPSEMIKRHAKEAELVDAQPDEVFQFAAGTGVTAKWVLRALMLRLFHTPHLPPHLSVRELESLIERRIIRFICPSPHLLLQFALISDSDDFPTWRPLREHLTWCTKCATTCTRLREAYEPK